MSGNFYMFCLCATCFASQQFFFSVSFLKIFLLGAGCNHVLSFNCFQCLTFVMQEKPHMFQFVPNEKQVTCSLQNVSYLTIKKKCILWYLLILYIDLFLIQVKEANKLLKKISRNNRKRRVEGVPVFTAQNLNIAIATVDGIKWYAAVLFMYFHIFFIYDLFSLHFISWILSYLIM